MGDTFRSGGLGLGGEGEEEEEKFRPLNRAAIDLLASVELAAFSDLFRLHRRNVAVQVKVGSAWHLEPGGRTRGKFRAL